MSRSPSDKTPRPTSRPPRRRLFPALCFDPLEERIVFNAAPTAPPTALFSSTIFVRVPVPISYSQLLATSGAHDADGDPIGFRILTVNTSAGLLFLNHGGATFTVVPSMLILPRDTLAWIPTTPGLLPGVTVQAVDAHSSASNGTAIYFNTILLPQVSVTPKQTQAWEAAPNNPMGTGIITVARTGNTSSPLTVTFNLTAAGGASSGVNFELLDGDFQPIALTGTLFTVKFLAGESSKNLVIRAIDDSTVATTQEEVTIQAITSQANPIDYTVSPAAWKATVNIMDKTPVISIKAAATSIPEGVSGQVAFIVTRTAAPGATLNTATTVHLNYTSSGFHMAGHFLATPAVVFAANQTQKTIFVTTINDGVATATQSISATISASGVRVTPNKATITLADPSPTVTIASSGTSIQEGTTATAFTLTRTAAAGQSLANAFTTVNISYTSSTFAVGNIIAPASVIFAPGETSKQIVVQTLDDGKANGTLVITGAISGTSFRAGTAKSANINVTDSATSVSISAVTATATAATPTTVVSPGRLRITRSGGNVNINLPVAFTVATGTTNAIRGTDFILADANNGAIAANVVTIPAGATTVDLLIVPLARDINRNSTATITLVNADIATTGGQKLYNVGTPASANVTINNTGAGTPTVFFGSASRNTTRNTPVTLDFATLVSLTGARVAPGSLDPLQLRITLPTAVIGTLQVHVNGAAAATTAANNTTLSAGDILVWTPPVDTSVNSVLAFSLFALDGSVASAGGTDFFITVV